MRRSVLFNVAAAVLLSSYVAFADDPAAVQKKLVETYSITQPTADLSDIVAAGSVLVLKQGRIVMAPTTGTDMCQNSYKDGRVSQNGFCKIMGRHIPGLPSSDTPQTRTFVPGEKMWVTAIKVLPDGVVFSLFTDAYSDVRYKAAMKFKFDKGESPSTEDVEKMVSEVFKVQESDSDSKNGDQQQQSQSQQQQQPQGSAKPAMAAAQSSPAPSATPVTAPAPLAPPPPPPEDPKTIAMGQTPEQVTSALGQPEKIVKLSNKQIYIYKDMRITFVGGKVSDVK